MTWLPYIKSATILLADLIYAIPNNNVALFVVIYFSPLHRHDEFGMGSFFAV